MVHVAAHFSARIPIDTSSIGIKGSSGNLLVTHLFNLRDTAYPKPDAHTGYVFLEKTSNGTKSLWDGSRWEYLFDYNQIRLELL